MNAGGIFISWRKLDKGIVELYNITVQSLPNAAGKAFMSRYWFPLLTPVRGALTGLTAKTVQTELSEPPEKLKVFPIKLTIKE